MPGSPNLVVNPSNMVMKSARFLRRYVFYSQNPQFRFGTDILGFYSLGFDKIKEIKGVDVEEIADGK